MYKMKTDQIKSSIEKRVDAIAVEHLYESVPSVVAGQIFMFIFVTAVLWSDANINALLGWMLAGIIFGLIRYVLYLNYSKQKISIDDAIKWGDYYAYASLDVGIIFGSATILFFNPQHFGTSSFIFTVIVRYSLGGFIVSAYWMKSLYFLTVPLLLISALRVSLEGNIEFIGTAVFIIIFLILATKYSIATNKSFMRSIRLQIEDMDFSKQFKEQKKLAEEANGAKTRFIAAEQLN